ncbi:Fe(3+) ABC transporter substrate-binding protein [Paenibacillus sp. IB182496]|uniref:Fe(3+) ABC transporter substrate-binding protein n=1 Tax=Paenibacillus sabuli TaxID=2772509 RepID=A0A927BQA0_9BACL|nr:Fe(3+) ABC transporter substrate-binding protein [Paenibacillus sabuli]MBD2843966.1 Fe(3+) ABC transporter substrate-binding protein [Paenibacillus sabuli]
MMRIKGIGLAAAMVVLVLLLAACGGGNNANEGADGGSIPAANGQAANSGGADEAEGQETSAADNEGQAADDGQLGGEVNVYSARHYDVDAELYATFTEETGIEVNIIEGAAPELIERIAREGSSSPADLFITVDGGILNTAKTRELLQPILSETVDAQVPADLRDTDDHWVGLSTRARVIVYAKDRVDPAELSTYEDLATDKWQGRLLVRSSTNLYNQSLLASLIALNGVEATERWAAGIAANLARDPEGGDRDQAKAIVAGEGDVAIMNTYYVGRMSVSEDSEEVKVAEQVGVFFPNQETTGTHLNLSGVGLVKYSPNQEQAIRLIEFLTAPAAQGRFSAANFEFPVNSDAEMPELLTGWGEFAHQGLDFAVYGEHNPTAVEIANKVGWK